MLKTSTLVKSVAFTGFISAATLSCLEATHAATIVNVNFGGVDYAVTTIQGSYDDLKDQLQEMPWWGTEFAYAYSFASTIGGALGTPNRIGGMLSGPLFSYSEMYSSVNFNFWYPEVPFASPAGVTSFMLYPYESSQSYTWAITSTPAAVPEPLTMLGAATAIGFGANFKRRLAKLKQAKKDA